MDVTLGVDIGGTKIALAAVDTVGDVIASERVPTESAEGFDAVVGRVVDGINRLRASLPDGANAVGVGVGTPGYVSGGVVRYAANLNWHDAPLQAALAAELGGLPVHVENDVRAIALGEARYGAAAGVADVLYVAVGTGLGMAAIVNGRLMTGTGGTALELGQMRVPPHWNDTTGAETVEQLLSGGGLLRMVRGSHGKLPSRLPNDTTLTTQAVLLAVEANDMLAVAMMQAYSQYLTDVAVWSVGVLNPSRVVLGGGMGTAAARWLLPALSDGLRERLPAIVVDDLTVVGSSLIDSALGAAALAWG
jgi:glucokinase